MQHTVVRKNNGTGYLSGSRINIAITIAVIIRVTPIGL